MINWYVHYLSCVHCAEYNVNFAETRRIITGLPQANPVIKCERGCLLCRKMTKLRNSYPETHSGQTQKSNATSGFRRLELCKSLKRKPARLQLENVIKIVL